RPSARNGSASAGGGSAPPEVVRGAGSSAAAAWGGARPATGWNTPGAATVKLVPLEPPWAAGPGAAVTVKLALLTATPPRADTPIGPVVAPLGTTTVICVPAALTVKLPVGTPLNATADTSKKLVPVMTTWLPTAPLG